MGSGEANRVRAMSEQASGQSHDRAGKREWSHGGKEERKEERAEPWLLWSRRREHKGASGGVSNSGQRDGTSSCGRDGTSCRGRYGRRAEVGGGM